MEMKHNLKYGMVLAFALLLHLIAINVANLSCSTSITPSSQDECFISQAAPSSLHGAYRHFHIYCATMPGEMGHADISHVPADKSFLRPEVSFRKYLRNTSFLSDISIHVSIHSLFDPLTYYVYGLRKILI